MWVRFPELPIEFYDMEVLKEIGSAIGPVLRIDSYTATGSRGSYAMLCIQIGLDKPLIKSFRIGRLVQQVKYEGISSLFFFLLWEAWAQIGELLLLGQGKR